MWYQRITTEDISQVFHAFPRDQGREDFSAQILLLHTFCDDTQGIDIKTLAASCVNPRAAKLYMTTLTSVLTVCHAKYADESQGLVLSAGAHKLVQRDMQVVLDNHVFVSDTLDVLRTLCPPLHQFIIDQSKMAGIDAAKYRVIGAYLVQVFAVQTTKTRQSSGREAS